MILLLSIWILFIWQLIFKKIHLKWIQGSNFPLKIIMIIVTGVNFFSGKIMPGVFMRSSQKIFRWVTENSTLYTLRNSQNCTVKKHPTRPYENIFRYKKRYSLCILSKPAYLALLKGSHSWQSEAAFQPRFNYAIILLSAALTVAPSVLLALLITPILIGVTQLSSSLLILSKMRMFVNVAENTTRKMM